MSASGTRANNPLYDLFFTRKADRHRQKLYRKDKTAKKLLENVLKDLMNDPYAGSYYLSGTGLLKGMRSMHAGKYRIVFAICEQCRTDEFDGHIACVDCDTKPNPSVVIFDLGIHDKAYGKKK